MEYRTLGRSGLKVSVLTMGTMTFGATEPLGSTDVAGATRQIDMCLDLGVNVIDTANVYAAGRSEEIVGTVLSGNGRRDRVILATKVRFAMGDGPNDNGLSRHHIIAQCEASLRRLDTDVIDLYQVHQWDGTTPLEETMEALDTLVNQGKVRYVGCSNFSGWHLMKALAVADARHLQRFVSQQIHYTLEAREAEYELVPIAVDQGLGIMVWSPLAGGLLTGKYRRDGAAEGGRHTLGWTEPPINDENRLYDIVDAVVDIAGSRGVQGAQVALAWLLQRPGVSTVAVGARTDEQLEQNLGSAELELSADEIARLDQVSQPPLLYPYWHQSMSVADRFSEADWALHDGQGGKRKPSTRA
jgi:aryl-alcohol dehydrogenase-like predicted oxidoreductase